MPISIIDEGRNNFIDVPTDFLENSKGEFRLIGNNNIIVIGVGSFCDSLNVICKYNSNLTIGIGVNIGSMCVDLLAPSRFEVGDNTAIMDGSRIIVHETESVIIGKNCLIGLSSLFSVGDTHSIIDIQSGSRINPARKILIGDHVWIGRSVAIFGGASIGNGSIIGMNSMVDGNIPCNTLAAGAPARVLRAEMSWQHDLI